MKQIYLLLSSMFIASVSFCQIMVMATAGTTGPTTYTTLKNAFDAVNAGTHKGVVSITITGTTTETATALLNASGTGSSSYTSLSFKPIGGTLSTVSGNIAGPLIDLNGADNVIIDGTNIDGNTLTLTNTNTGSSGNISTIRFMNDASGNIVKNTTILGASTSTTLGTVLFSTGTATGNISDTIYNCNIADAAGSFATNGIYSSGSTTAGMQNIVMVLNNSIYNFFNPGLVSTGILVEAGNTDWTISNNKFFQTAARTYTAGAIHRAIQVTGGNAYIISGNTIGYASATATGNYTMNGAFASRFIGIDLAVGNTKATSVQDNSFSNFSLVTTSGASTFNGVWCAINVTSGDVNIGTLLGNTIGSTTATGSIVVSPTTGGAAIVPINSSSIDTIVVSNNTIGGIDLLPTGVLSGNIQSIQTSGTGGSITITNNIIGNTIVNNIRIGVVGTTTGNGLIRGVFNSNNGTITISGNIIRNLTHNSSNALALFRAIETQQGETSITNNIISYITANGASTGALTPEGAGILATTAVTGLLIHNNVISNLSVASTTATTGPVIMGIYLGSAVNGVSVIRNKINAISNAGTSTSTTAPSIIAGIYLRDAGTANPNILVANNMVSLGTEQPTNTSIIGIWNGTASANGLTSKIYYNTVNIEGTVSTGAQPSFCYYRGDFGATAFATPIVDLKNNLFTNTRSGSTGKHYAIANGYPNTANAGGWPSNASDYNILNANNANIGYWSGDATFATWKTSSLSDDRSYSDVIITYANSSNDLHLVTTSNFAAEKKATPIISITNDIDNNTRDAVTPDIGADEFLYSGPAVPIKMEYFMGKKNGSNNLLNWKGSCTSSSITFTIERSNDGNKFQQIGSFNATQTRCAQPFDFTDNSPKPGINYYRLKMTEADGKVSYSIVIGIMNKEVGFEIINMMPSIVTANSTLNITTAQDTQLEIAVMDMSGKILMKQSKSIVSGSNTIPLNLSQLAAGTYQLVGNTPDGKTSMIRFVKH
jgi:hypothetical protein